MTGETGNPRVSPFDAIRHTSEDSSDYWSARELGPLLGYRKWENFRAVIAKARMACESSGYPVTDHFPASRKMVTLGSGAQREVEANRAHHDVGAAARQFIINDLGGTPPEQLPTPAESIQQLEARERRRVERERQPTLFLEVGSGESDGQD